MLSKKMAVSLMSLITIFAFVIAAPTATADVLGKDFKTTITINGGTGASMVLGDNVVQTGRISLKAAFDKPVASTDLTAAKITIAAFNKTTGAAPTNAPVAASIKVVAGTEMKEYTFSVTNVEATPGNPFTVLVTIAKGAVTNNDPTDVIKAGTGDDTLGTNDKGSLKFDVVVAPRDTDPQTISVTNYPVIVLGPGNPDAFTFTVTLSEKPKEFKKDHIDITNATVSGDPIALPAVSEPTTPANLSSEFTNRLYPYLVDGRAEV